MGHREWCCNFSPFGVQWDGDCVLSIAASLYAGRSLFKLINSNGEFRFLYLNDFGTANRFQHPHFQSGGLRNSALSNASPNVGGVNAFGRLIVELKKKVVLLLHADV